MKHFKRVLNKLKCKELVSNTLQLHILTVRVIDGKNIHINNSIQKVVIHPCGLVGVEKLAPAHGNAQRTLPCTFLRMIRG